MDRIAIATGVLLMWLSAAAEPAKPLQYPDVNIIKALSEMHTLGDCEEVCGAETTYFVALEALNDLSTYNPTRYYDYINNGGGSYAIRPSEGRFRPSRIDFLTAINPWEGPYITYQAGQYQTGTTPYDQGSPLDPWGNPYYFFTPLGLARGDTGKITLELYGDAFDQYTIVSLGPDGVMNTGGTGDDLFYPFGGGVSILALTSIGGALLTNPVSPSFSAAANTTVTLRGRNLGTAAANAKVFFNATEVSSVISWTSTAIKVVLPWTLAGQSGSVTIHRGTGVSNALALTITGNRNAARDWALYE